MRECLEESFDQQRGKDEGACAAAESQEEQQRQRLCESARSALEAALGEDEVEEPAAMLGICQSAREALEAALMVSDSPEQSLIPPVPRLDAKVGPVPAALLEAVATADRRIGALVTIIKETQRQIIDRD
eukprot:5900660-Amphidinium_carterae.1